MKPMLLVHEALSTSAREHAAKVALVGAPSLSYAALDAATSALARHLRAARTTVGDRVAIWLPKDHPYAVSIFGALKAGCAYVPLDGSQPVARALAILADAEPSVLVTERDRLDRLAAGGLPSSVREIVLTGEDPLPSIDGVRVRRFADLLDPSAHADIALPRTTLQDLAAILYTSGSTGIPKGVRISHLNLASFITWAHDEMQLGPDDVFCNHASFNFDLSTFDLFASTRAGASLWIVPDAEARNVVAFSEGLARHRVTVVYAVPSILALLVTSSLLTPAIAERLRYVLFAGEVYPIARLRELKAALRSETGLYNLYGPTETNVCTWYRVREIADDRVIPVPIGRAVTGATLSVVGDDGKPLADPTAIGELVVEGPCVTPGYFRRADDRNTENHRRNAHATGDLVSWEDGELVYRGRKDRMLKIAGYRVELGEIEAAIASHDAIAEVGVVAKGEGGEAKLVAYYALAEQAIEPSLIELKTHCGRLLPRYMLPHTAVRLTTLPKNPNGKIDYPALAKLQDAGDAAARAAGRAGAQTKHEDARER